jgi:hypothetical protein
MSKRILKYYLKKSHKLKGGENLCDTYSKKQDEYINIYNHEAQKINKIRTKSADITNRIKKIKIEALSQGKKAQEYLDKNSHERLAYRMEMYDTVLVDVIKLIKESLALLKSTASGELKGGYKFIVKMNEALDILDGGYLLSGGLKSDLTTPMDANSLPWKVTLYKEIKSLVDQSKIIIDKETVFVKDYIEDVSSKLTDPTHPKSAIKTLLKQIQLELFPNSKDLSNDSQEDNTEFDLDSEIEKIGRPFDAEVFKPIDKFLIDNYQHTCFTPIDELVVMVDETIDNSINAIIHIFDKVQKVVPRIENIIISRVKERIDRIKSLMETCATSCLKPLTVEEMKQECAKIKCVPKNYTIHDDDEDEDVFGECSINDKECKQIRDMCNYSYRSSLEGKEVCPNESEKPSTLKKAVIAAKAVDDLNKDVENVRANKIVSGKEEASEEELCIPKCSIDEKGNYLGTNWCDGNLKAQAIEMKKKYRDKFGENPEKPYNGVQICKNEPNMLDDKIELAEEELCIPKCSIDEKGNYLGTNWCDGNLKAQAIEMKKKYRDKFGESPEKPYNGVKICEK